MRTLSLDELHFLARFARSPDGVQWLKFLEEMERETVADMRKASGEHVYRVQGALNAIDDLRKLMTGADQILKRQAAPPRRIAA